MPRQVPAFMCLRVQPWGHHCVHGSLGLLARAPFVTALPSAWHSPGAERAADWGAGVEVVQTESSSCPHMVCRPSLFMLCFLF